SVLRVAPSSQASSFTGVTSGGSSSARDSRAAAGRSVIASRSAVRWPKRWRGGSARLGASNTRGKAVMAPSIVPYPCTQARTTACRSVAAGAGLGEQAAALGAHEPQHDPCGHADEALLQERARVVQREERAGGREHQQRAARGEQRPFVQ